MAPPPAAYGAAATLPPSHLGFLSKSKAPDTKEVGPSSYGTTQGKKPSGKGTEDDASLSNYHEDGTNDAGDDSNAKAHQNGHGFAETTQCVVLPAARLEKWKAEMRTISERCDLSGLAREPVRYQLAAGGVDHKVMSTKDRTIDIAGGLLQNLKATISKRQIAPETLLSLAAHQMLRAFGNGTHTATATLSRKTSAFCPTTTTTTWMVRPTLVSHQARDSKYMSTAISEIKAGSEANEDARLVSVASSKLLRSEWTDLVIVLDGAVDEAPVPGVSLVLGAALQESSWTLTMRYAHGLLDAAIVDGFLGAVRTFLEATTRPTQLLGLVQVLSRDQLAQMDAWNDTDGTYPAAKRLHHLVEEVAERCPDRVAVICGSKRVTYTELNAQANRLARYICSRGVRPEQLIGLLLDKSEMMIEAVLGVWKSGAAHVPIDPSYPDERIRFVLDDINMSSVIVSERHVPRLRGRILGNRAIDVIPLEPLLRRLSSETDGCSPAAAAANLSHSPPLTSRQLAYVTYTSGTTGLPKGIFKEHASVVNSITDLSARYGVAGSDDEVILLFSAYVFEPFVRQMLMALTTGNRLAIISDEAKFDQDVLIRFIRHHGVTYINGTASVLQEYDFTACPSLRRMILVGENLTDARYGAIRRRFEGRILNEYGFTESAFVTALKVLEPGSERTDMSLGRPVRNVKCYILDEQMRRVPPGVRGELYVGGLGVTRGYMNREELTRERFRPNPYQTPVERKSGANGRVYRTGDLARWLPNGEIEYLGRVDFQIKLRGIRIEPGEIESTLASHPAVRTSVVVSRKLLAGGRETTTDQHHLVGYFVSHDGAPLPENQLLSFLEKKLPRYMVPARLIQLPAIPVTVNGKADLRALPEAEVAEVAASSPDEEAATATAAAAASPYRDEVDKMLTDAWGDVLGIPARSIGLQHNFFRLGGHSITCIQLIARVREVLGVSFGLEEVFETKTLGAMADLLRSRRTAEFSTAGAGGGGPTEADPAASARGPDGQQRSYLANSLQQGFVYHSLKTGQTDAYVMQSVLRYGVPLQRDVYRAAWEHVHRRHPALRLRFSWEGEVVQTVDPDAQLDWRVVDVDADADAPDGAPMSEAEMQHTIGQLRRRDNEEGYRLSEASLVRLYYVQTSGRQCFCLFSCHHAVLDGWSLPLLFDCLHEAYLCLSDGRQPPPPPDEDTAYLSGQRYLEEHRDDHLRFWADEVDRIGERCDLNVLLNEASRYKVSLADYDRVRDQGRTTVFLARDAGMAELLEECSAMGATLHSVLQLAWHLVLHAYGGGSHTVTGTTISGRNLPVRGVERSVGLFINTLPLVLDHASYRDMTVMEAIVRVQSQVNAINAHGNVELGRLGKDDLRHGLFDTLFVLENYPEPDAARKLTHERLLGHTVTGGDEKLSYPLAVIAREEQGAAADAEKGRGCSLTVCYARELFADDTVEALLHAARDALRSMAESRHARIRDLEHLSAAQAQRLDRWNATEDEYPSGTLHSLFEAEAQRKPNRTAVIYEDTKLSYRELNGRANALAFHLLERTSVGPDRLVALVMDKSEHMITSILAVWKSGGAYVPIDPAYPDDRIKYILGDTAATAVIADRRYVARLSKLVAVGSRRAGVPVIVPSDAAAVELSPSPTHPSGPACRAADLAYVMYTSGTTGTPKGVMVEHRGVVNLAVSLSSLFGLRDTDDEVILSFSNYVFDHFVEQMTDALLNGQTLLVLNDDMRGDKERLYRYMETNRVTYLSGTPSVISMYEFGRFRDHLRRIDCVGEAFSEPVFDKIRETFPGLIINGYGPTEVSITTHKRLYPYPERRTDRSIGRQVANTTSYVLDQDMKRVPIGAVGELYLGGDGVARGYHNRADLTEARFPANPFQTETERRQGRNARLYRTGDLVRWVESADGELEYLGRNDFQVKIRGQRIELGEIEAVLSSHPDVVQSVVMARDRPSDGQKYLVGYYVSAAGGAALSPRVLRRHMQARLPAHMVPAKMVAMDWGFPVTASGKLDAKALPAPEDAPDDEDVVVPPRTEVEKVVAGIWSDLLGAPIETIGIHSDFFSLGGDSLRSTRLSFAATKALGVSVSVSSLFRHPTIESFARWVVSGSADAEAAISPLSTKRLASVPLSPAQERLVLLHERHRGGGGGGGSAYNIAMQLELDEDVCLEAFEKSLRSVVARHEALRTLLVSRAESSGGYRQEILDAEDAAQRMFSLKTKTLDSTAQLLQEMNMAAQTVFRLDRELPFAAFLFQLRSSSGCRPCHYATLVFHHSAFDAWSWNVFCHDLAEFYALHAGGKTEVKLARLDVQYKEYAVEHRRVLTTPRLRVLSEFWSARLSGLEPVCLVTDRPRPAEFNHNGGDARRSLNRDTASRLRATAKREGATLYAVMLSAYCHLLHVYTMQTDISVGVPVAHRTRAEYEPIVGFFVNLLPLRVDVSGHDVRGLVAEVQRRLVDSQIHMDMPFQEMTKLVRQSHDPSLHPLIQTVFNWEVQPVRDDTTTAARPPFRDFVPTSSPLASAAKFDLNVTVTDMADGTLDVNFNYPTCLFDEDTVQGYLDSYVALLDAISAGPPDLPLSQLAIVDLETQTSPYLPTMTETRSAGTCSELGGDTLHALFESHAASRPDKTAVVEAPDSRISYADLNARANQLAHHMADQRGIRSGDRVALMLDKSIEMLVCVLAVWKAGAAYVPLDPGCPAQRVDLIMRETGAELLLTTARVVRRRRTAGHDHEDAEAGQHLMLLDDPSTLRHVRAQSPANPASPATASPMLAYIIYTSGTTGRPKGVMVGHEGVAALQRALSARYFGADSNDAHAVLFLSNYVFDFSVEQIALSILSGNTLVIPPEEGVTHEAFYELANAERLSYLSGTPSVLHQMQLSRIESLQVVTAAGEELHRSQFAHIRRQFAGRINNAYGVTETTVYNLVTTFEHDAPFTKELRDELPGCKAYVLNDALRQVPINAVGELYLAGGCVARGYLNQDGLTRQRFVPNPFRGVDDDELDFGRMYKTGDLVRYRGPGRLEYLGRRDQQIKLRGVRIELSEVQTALASIPGVGDAAVLPVYSGHDDTTESASRTTVSELVGYYNGGDGGAGAAPAPSAVRKMLSSLIPSFMVPSKLRLLRGPLPVTINGKLDSRKLASLVEQEETPVDGFAAPRNAVEAKLCLLWAAATGRAHSGIDDDLFASGGDSISCLKLVGDVYRELGSKVSVKDIFVHRTVRAVFENVLSREGTQRGLHLLPPLRADQGLVDGTAPLLPIQNWFLSKKLQRPEHWNHCFAIRTPSLDAGRLAEAVRLLQLRHDVLRMRVEIRNGRAVQRFATATRDAVAVEVVDIRSLGGGAGRIENELSTRQSCFNMADGPLFTIAYLHGYEDGSARVWCSFHHLIVDTVSWGIIRSDLRSLYHGADLGMKTSSVRQWALAVERYTPSRAEKEYWEEIRGRSRRGAALLLAAGQSDGRARCEDAMSVEETVSLLQRCCSRLHVGVHEMLLMSVGSALQQQQVLGGAPTVVTIEGHGREESVDPSLEVSRTVGWFTSMYPFEIPQVSDPVGGVLEVKQGVDSVPNHGIGYGACYGYSDGYLPAVSVNYLGRLDQGQAGPLDDDWALVTDEDGLSAGLHTSADDRDASSSIVDITFAVAKGRLSMQVTGALGHEVLQSLVDTTGETLRRLISRVGSREFEAPMPTASPGDDYTPFIIFDDDARRGPPLFLLPPGEGGAESYLHNLVQGLPNRQLVVFNNLYRHSKALSTFEQLAEYYMTLLRGIQPRGPYHILGWSFGGVLATEMAQRLGRQGERLGTLALVDAYFDVPGAVEEALGRTETGVLDAIYDVYRPERGRFEVLEECADRLVLFKAHEADERPAGATRRQRELYKWYAASPMNRLDVFVRKEAVEVVRLEGSHFGWVHQQEGVSRMCAFLDEKF